jgi:hypothetical protein
VTYKLTPLAIVSAFVLTIPGLIVGGVAAFLYRSFLLPLFDGNLINWITAGWFETLTMAILPNAIHGAIAGALAIWVSFKIISRANYEIVAYSVSAIVVAFAALGFVAGIVQRGLSLSLIELASNTIGIVIGLFIAWSAVKDDQSKRFSQEQLAGGDAEDARP